ncbi:unnamed protein product [Natator depressus]
MSSYSYFHQTGSNVLLGDGKKRREHCCINQISKCFTEEVSIIVFTHMCVSIDSVEDIFGVGKMFITYCKDLSCKHSFLCQGREGLLLLRIRNLLSIFTSYHSLPKGCALG